MPRTISRPDESLSFRNASCNSTISQKACHVASRFICRDSSFEYRSSLTEHLRQVSIVGHPVSVLFGVSSSTFRPFRRTDLFGEGRRAVVSRTAVWHPNQPIPIHSANLCDDGQTGNHGLDVLRDSRPSTHRARARAPTPHTATLFNVLAKVNLFAQARIETSKAVPCVIYNPRNLVEIANIRYYVARSRSALPIFVRTTETRTHQRKRREGSGG